MVRGGTGVAAPRRRFRPAHCLQDTFAIRSGTEAGPWCAQKDIRSLVWWFALRHRCAVLHVLQLTTRAAPENRDPTNRDEHPENARLFLRCPRVMQLKNRQRDRRRYDRRHKSRTPPNPTARKQFHVA